MSAINGLGVKNLRSLGDTGELPIKRLNLLVGRNSGGKSTFARILPLVRQSTEVRKRSPVLWYGRLVDFGSFKDSVRDSDISKEIELTFRLTLDKSKTMARSVSPFADDDERTYDVLATITLIAGKDGVETTVSRLFINFDGIDCQLNFSEGKLSSFQVGDSLEVVSPALHQQISFTGLLPNIHVYKYQKVKVRDQEFLMPEETNIFSAPLVREIATILKTGDSNEAAEILSRKIKLGSDKEILAQLKLPLDGPQRWLKFCEAVTERTNAFNRFRDCVLMARLPQLINLVDETISALAKNVRYLEPLRATAQRYYRRQELAIDELDSRGENVPFFLDNLEYFEKKNLDNWLLRHFGISVETQSSGGHIAIRLKMADSKRAVNLADTGFGYSQVLPIALQLWSLTQNGPRRSTSDAQDQKLVVMEQPELHLHPALQAKLADILVACISDESADYFYINSDLRITVETHSPSLINRVGELISMGAVQPEHVQVILFEKDEESGVTKTRVSHYGEDGRLKNWPYGFFDAVDEDYDFSAEQS